MFDLGQNVARRWLPHSRAGRRSLFLTTNHYRPTTAPAFTLIELLVVLAIIGLVVALGVPLFGVLTGAKSVEAGRNVVAAALGQARTVAVNEGKYAGVMFYVDPATERTAMSIVVVTDPASSLEDADPYDKYKTWRPSQQYFSGKLDAGQATPTRGDRVIGLAADADTTFRGLLYPQTSPLASEYLRYFGNYRPTVRAYRCTETHAAAAARDQVDQRPPRNGPYGPYPGSTPVPQQYRRPTGGTSGAPNAESKAGPFSNALWGLENQTEMTRYSTGEQQLLPRGVGVQLLIQPVQLAPGTNPPTERYLRTGVIMFDPQGRLVIRDFSLDSRDALGQYIQLSNSARSIRSGIGLALYDMSLFKAAGFTEADAVYQAARSTPIIAPTNPAFNDYVSDTAEVATSPATSEELWLDTNGTPLVINRYTGSMSEAE